MPVRLGSIGISSSEDCCGGLRSEEIEFKRFDRMFSGTGGLGLSLSDMEKLRFLELLGGKELSVECDSDGDMAVGGSWTTGRGRYCCCC